MRRILADEAHARYLLTCLRSCLDGLPKRSVVRVCERRPSDRDLERALTDTQLASGKSLVVICSSAFRDWMPSACAAHALTNA